MYTGIVKIYQNKLSFIIQRFLLKVKFTVMLMRCLSGYKKKIISLKPKGILQYPKTCTLALLIVTMTYMVETVQCHGGEHGGTTVALMQI